ncbi:RelA/SpoT domain-containing protein [Candidatus Woesearchaeota archaeon]|nr:RelA/SpoT domain-containing protein [Candidatus Woesearchaeota archaeon]
MPNTMRHEVNEQLYSRFSHAVEPAFLDPQDVSYQFARVFTAYPLEKLVSMSEGTLLSTLNRIVHDDEIQRLWSIVSESRREGEVKLRKVLPDKIRETLEEASIIPPTPSVPTTLNQITMYSLEDRTKIATIFQTQDADILEEDFRFRNVIYGKDLNWDTTGTHPRLHLPTHRTKKSGEITFYESAPKAGDMKKAVAPLLQRVYKATYGGHVGQRISSNYFAQNFLSHMPDTLKSNGDINYEACYQILRDIKRRHLVLDDYVSKKPELEDYVEYLVEAIDQSKRIHLPYAEVQTRVKSWNSMAMKLLRTLYDRKTLGEQGDRPKSFQDMFGIRVIVRDKDQVYDFYEAFKVIVEQSDGLMRIDPALAKDYIKNPKGTGYQSLHVPFMIGDRIGDQVQKYQAIELQIRSVDMDINAEIHPQMAHNHAYTMQKKEVTSDIPNSAWAIINAVVGLWRDYMEIPQLR